MKQYALNVYLERFYNLTENSDLIPSLDKAYLDELEMLIREIWDDGFYAGIDSSEKFNANNSLVDDED